MGICEFKQKRKPETKETVISNKIINEVIPFTHGKPMSIDEIKELYSYETAICKIKVKITGSGTGFFCEINDDSIPFKKALFTNNHVLNEICIDTNKEIKFEYCQKENKIRITENRKVFTNKELDYTCIEIFDTDKINKFFKIDQNIFNNKDSLKNKEIFILQYPYGELSHDSGKILGIQNNILIHSVSTEFGSSGSPLIKRYNIHLIIGLHRGGNETQELGNKVKYNIATSFDSIIKNIKAQLSNKNVNEIRNTKNLIYEKESIPINNITINTNQLNKLIKIQSIIRGFLDRKKINTYLISKKNSLSLKSTRTNPTLEYDYFKVVSIQRRVKGFLIRKKINKLRMRKKNSLLIANSKITDDEIQKLFKKYPPLNDGVPVELKKRFEYEDKSLYYGEWEKYSNKRHGRGIQIWTDKSRYEGYWKEDKINIRGKMTNSDGDIYEGEYLNNKAHGYGVYISLDGAKYQGNWKEDKQDGKGKEIFPDGICYEGDYKQGKKSGHGKFKWADGSTYEGQIEDNNINGKGILTWGDRRQYIGDWKNNKMDGHGVFTWADGRKYKGDYKNDKKNGFGIFEWVDGKKYRGYWINGKQNGEGEFYDTATKQWKKCLIQNGKKIKWIN